MSIFVGADEGSWILTIFTADRRGRSVTCEYTFNNDVDVVRDVPEVRRRDTRVRRWLTKIT